MTQDNEAQASTTKNIKKRKTHQDKEDDETNEETNEETNGETNGNTTKKRINAPQKVACKSFFEACGRFNRNSKLPVAGGMPQFDAFLVGQGLVRSQAVTQFKNWKRDKYEFYGEIYENDPTKLREQVTGNMPYENDEFIDNVIDILLTKPGINAMMRDKHPCTIPFYKYLKSDVTDNPFRAILVDIPAHYVEFMVASMPKRARMLPKAENEFFDKRSEMKHEKANAFLKAARSFQFPDDLIPLRDSFKDDALWKAFVLDMETKIYFYWCRARFSADLPPLVISDKCIVSKFALAMVYFTAGVVLRKIGNKKNTNFKKREKISEYVFTTHSVGLDNAKAANLPTRICESRKKSPVCPSSGFFEFIRIVESTFVKNATTEMMIAYCDGSLFDKIKDTLIESKEIVKKFSNQLHLASHSDEDVKSLLLDMLTIYRNIRSRWFINKVKGQKIGSKDYTTRNGVQFKCERALASAEARSEVKVNAEMYQQAIENADEVDTAEDDEDLVKEDNKNR